MSQDVEAEELKKLYKELMRANHPDKGGDPAKRAEYTNAFQIIMEFLELPDRVDKLQKRVAELSQLIANPTGPQCAEPAEVEEHRLLNTTYPADGFTDSTDVPQPWCI